MLVNLAMVPHATYLVVRFSGFRMVEKVDEALTQVEAEMRRLDLPCVLLDLRQLIGVLTGYDRNLSIQILMRRLGHAKCALLIDPTHYVGVDHSSTLSQGMTAAVFDDEDSAVQWLLGGKPPPDTILSSD